MAINFRYVTFKEKPEYAGWYERSTFTTFSQMAARIQPSKRLQSILDEVMEEISIETEPKSTTISGFWKKYGPEIDAEIEEYKQELKARTKEKAKMHKEITDYVKNCLKDLQNKSH